MKKFIVLFSCCMISFIIDAQNIEKINYVLDSVEYYNYMLAFNYWDNVILPDSIKSKMIKVLNGYLPPKAIANVNKFSVGELQNMTEYAKKKCKKDMGCVRRTKDSLKSSSVEFNLNYIKNKEFPPEFILALGGWDVYEARQILWENRNNTKRFPKVETYMALARFGYSEALDSVLKWMRFDIYSDDISYLYSERYIKKTITNFAFTAKYLRCKQFFMRIIDLFDLETYGQDPIWNTEDDSFYPSESIIFEILLKRRFEGLEEKFPTAYDELKDIRYKWESFMPTIYDKEEVMKFNKEMEYMYWIMPAISNKGLNFINDVCDRKIIIDVDSKTVETIEKICSDDVSDIELEHLINVLKTFCADDIDEKDIRCFVEMKQFRKLGLKEQMKADVREWIDKYVTFDE